MSEKYNDIHFTASDIEKYHKGLLSPKQMHAMEKAALDDPFLADAMEGYQDQGIKSDDNLVELQGRLAARLEDKKVISLVSAARKSPFPLLRAAAMIVAIVGAGLLVYQFAFKDQSSKNIADNPTTTQPTVKKAAPEQKDASAAAADSSIIPETLTEAKENATTRAKIEADNRLAKKEEKEVPTIALPAPSIVAEKKAAVQKVDNIMDKQAQDTLNDNQSFYKDIAGNTKSVDISPGLRKMPVTVQSEVDFSRAKNRQESTALNMKVYESGSARGFSEINQFRGQVRDAANNPLPFANITNTTDNVGTYSDAKGNFILTSPDTVLHVQVRSLGFENTNQQLRNNVASNQVILQDDNRSLSEVVISNKKVNSTRERNQHMILEEPEPADGWEKYDTYLANNLNLPESLKSKEKDDAATINGEVELSFEVNRFGQPVKIKVEKSLCDKCDKEAIRLIKEGPKWKAKSKRGRTSVKVAF
jgi:hypothetical protein